MVQGSVGSYNDMLLVDSGASHNFIGQQTIDRMKVRVRKRAQVAVRLANG